MKLIEQNKFSENVISFRYLLDLDKETITACNLLSYMLKAKTEEYTDKYEVSMAFNKNYGCRLYIGLSSYGKILSFQYRFQYIRSNWIEDPQYTENIIHVLDQFLFHSVLTEQNLVEAKFLLKNRLKMQRDDPFYISIMNAFSIIDGQSTISIPVQGILEKVDEVSLEDIKNIYRCLQQQKPFVYACGEIEEGMKEYLEDKANNGVIACDYSILKPGTFKEKRMVKDIEQTWLTKAYATNVDPTSKEFDALLLMNSVLGQAPVNLLFEEVREKHSYCYTIGSNIVRFDGVLYIYVGCKKEYIENVLSLIDIQLQKIIDMEYSDELLEIAKKDWKDGIVAGLDNQLSYIERAFMREFLKTNRSIQERIEAIDSVTKEEISQVAKQLKEVSLSIVQEEE